MRSEWEEVKLGDFVDFNPRETLKKGVISKKVGMADVMPYQKAIYRYEITPYTSGTKFKNGDVLFARITPCLENGKIAQVRFLATDEVAFGSTEFIVWRKRDNISEEEFIYYLAMDKYIQDIAIKSMVGSSGRQRVQLDVLENTKLTLPPLPTQRAIADTLSCLDAKIELNNKVNKNLEAQAQAIFKSWFVDFEPFKDGEFVESELGLIPKGWRVGKLGDASIITMGQSPKGETYNEDSIGTVFYQGRAEFGWRFPTRRLYTTDPKRFAEKNDVLMSVRAPVGDINVAQEDCCIGRGLAAIQNKNYQSFILYTMYAIYTKLNQFNAEGTVFGSINKGDLHNMPVIVPPDEIITKFENAVAAIDKQVFSLSYQSTTLSALRDLLLPGLMSGEIEVPTGTH